MKKRYFTIMNYGTSNKNSVKKPNFKNSIKNHKIKCDGCNKLSRVKNTYIKKGKFLCYKCYYKQINKMSRISPPLKEDKYLMNSYIQVGFNKITMKELNKKTKKLFGKVNGNRGAYLRYLIFKDLKENK